MANTAAPFGLRPVKYRGGRDYTGQCNMYYVPSSDGTALFKGDPVITAGSASADGYATVTRATAAGGYIKGVVVGFVPQEQIPANKHRPASTAMYVLVADDEDLIFEAEEDAAGGSLAVTNVGQNIDLIAGAGSTTTGLSGWMLDSSTAATTNTLSWRIEGFSTKLDNIGTTYQRMLVSQNLSTNKNLTGI